MLFLFLVLKNVANNAFNVEQLSFDVYVIDKLISYRWTYVNYEYIY